MPTFSDTPTSEGATNVALNQRAASAPYRREEVNIQGDENAGRAIGFDDDGRLTTLVVDENPFATVDTEAQLDAALAAGRSIVLRGEGVGGVIPMTTEKDVNFRFTEVRGPGHLQLTMPPGGPNPRAFTVHADDVTFRNFELSATQSMDINNCFGIGFCDDPAHNHGHRMRVIDMHIHNWCRCISKVDKTDEELTVPTTTHLDCLIDRLYAHTFRDYGLRLDYGMHRLVMRDSRVIGRLAGEVHTTNNALHGGIRWEDNSFVNCIFSDVDMIGFEATLGGYANYHRRTRLYGCRAENCGWMGFSTMFGTGILIDKCVAKKVKGCGFEIGGRPPEQVPPVPNDPAYYRYGQGIFDSCVVDGVTPSIYSVGQAKGISIDGAEDTVVRGSTFIRNIHSDEPDGSGAVGVDVTNSERCSVMDGTFVDAGHACIFFAAGLTPNNRGFHEAVGNTFRNSTGALPHYGVLVANTTVSVCNNTTWQKSGTSLTNAANTLSPAKVYCDGIAVAWSVPATPPATGYVPVPFTGSNLILPC